jgi:tetraacyldisaccharide 4'-kinase
LREYLYKLATDKEKGPIAAIIKALLFVLSLFYGLSLSVIIFLRRRRLYSLGCKVISVGNITLGGTGKTVLVEYIARHLKEKGHKVAILTRGYKRKDTRIQGQSATKSSLPEGDQAASYEEVGDEAYMLAKKLNDIPVLVDADRIRAAKKAIQDYSADTLILDDGFQQWHIRKDLDIVTLDAQKPFGNKKIIPRGILREPLAGLKRADIFMLTKTNLHPDPRALKAFLESLNPCARIFESGHKPTGFIDLKHPQESIDAETLRGKSAVLFCGIGDPDSFAALLSSLGLNIAAFLKFADHHDYTRQDIDNIIKTAKEKSIDTIVTTEKDAVRITAAGLLPAADSMMPQGLGFLVLRIQMEIKDEQEFHNRLLGMYSG